MDNDKKTMGDKKVKTVSAPAGFDTRVGREQGKGWMTKEAGAQIEGRLLGRFLMKGDDGDMRAFYQIQLNGNHGIMKAGNIIGPIKGTTRDPEDRDNQMEVEFNDGDILNLGEHKALEDLSPYTRDGGIYDVHIHYVGEEKIQGTKRTFWAIKGPFLKTIKAATRAPGPEPLVRSVTDDDGKPIPF